MKKGLLVCLFTIVSFLAKAQDGYTYVGIRGGWVAEKAYSVTLNLDLSSSYFSSYELFGEFYKNYTTTYKTVMGGVVYKPALIRNRNSLLKFRFGGGIGAGREGFIAAPQIGWEFSQSVFNNIDILLVNRNQFVFFDTQPDVWRVGFELGLRLPL